jgi:hypothetical protein
VKRGLCAFMRVRISAVNIVLSRHTYISSIAGTGISYSDPDSILIWVRGSGSREGQNRQEKIKKSLCFEELDVLSVES